MARPRSQQWVTLGDDYAATETQPVDRTRSVYANWYEVIVAIARCERRFRQQGHSFEADEMAAFERKVLWMAEQHCTRIVETATQQNSTASPPEVVDDCQATAVEVDVASDAGREEQDAASQTATDLLAGAPQLADAREERDRYTARCAVLEGRLQRVRESVR